jgi:hypothetical protein
MPKGTTTVRKGISEMLAAYVRLSLIEAWRELEHDPAERGSLAQRLSVAIWSLDPRSGAHVLLAEELPRGTVATPPRAKAGDEGRLHPEGFGHFDLAWRERRPLYVRSLLHSTRSLGVLGSHDDGAAETFIAPVGAHYHAIPVVIYARLAPGAASPAARRDPEQCAGMSSALCDLASTICDRVQAVVDGLRTGAVRFEPREPPIKAQTSASTLTGVTLEGMAAHLLACSRAPGRMDTTPGIGAVVPFQLSDDGGALEQLPASVDEGALAALWTRLVQRAIFERADSRVGGPIDAYVRKQPGRPDDGISRPRVHEVHASRRVSAETHPSLAIHEAFTTQYRVPVADGEGTIQAIFNLNLDLGAPAQPGLRGNLDMVVSRLVPLGKALRALRPRGSATPPFVVTDVGADILRRILHELTAQTRGIEERLTWIQDQLRGLSRRWGFSDVARLERAVDHLRDRDLAEALRFLRAACEQSAIVSAWMPLYPFRLAFTRGEDGVETDDIWSSSPGAPELRRVGGRRHTAAEMFAQRRDVAALVRLMTSMAATPGRAWPVGRHHGSRPEDRFVAVELDDGTTHITTPWGPGAVFPYNACAFVPAEKGTAFLVLSSLDADALTGHAHGLVEAALSGAAPEPQGEHVVTRWNESRHHFDLVASVHVPGTFSSHQAGAWRGAGGGARRLLAPGDRALLEHGGFALPLDRVRERGRFSAAFIRLHEHVLGVRSGRLDEHAKDCARDLAPVSGQESFDDEQLVSRAAPFVRLLVELGAGFREREEARLGDLRADQGLGLYGAASLARVVYVRPVHDAEGRIAGLLACLGTARRLQEQSGASELRSAFDAGSPERELADELVEAYRGVLRAPPAQPSSARPEDPWTPLRRALESGGPPPPRSYAKVEDFLKQASASFDHQHKSFPPNLTSVWDHLMGLKIASSKAKFKRAPDARWESQSSTLRYAVLMTCLLNAAPGEDTSAKSETQGRILGINMGAWRKRDEYVMLMAAVDDLKQSGKSGLRHG